MKFTLPLLAALCAAAAPAHANDWLACATITDSAERLGCFDQKARQFANPVELQVPPAVPYATLPMAATEPPVASAAQRVNAQPSEITRFWDLEHATARDNFELRAYRPVSLSVVGGTTRCPTPPRQVARRPAPSPTSLASSRST